MVFSRKEQWRIFIAVNAIILLAVLLFPLYDKYVAVLPLSRCGLLEYLHLYCPACGGTRAFAALISFDIPSSLKYNPVVLMTAALLVIYEVMMIKHLIKGGDRELFIKPWMVFVFLGIWLAYSIVRNVLLFNGIDLLGNVLC